MAKLIRQGDRVASLLGGNENAEAAASAFASGAVSLSLDAIRTVGKDTQTTLSKCAAQVSVAIQQPARDAVQTNAGLLLMLSQVGWRTDQGKLVRSVEYTTQPTDDRKQLFVQLNEPGEVILGANLIAAATSRALASQATNATNDQSGAKNLERTTATQSAAGSAQPGSCAGDLSVTANALDCEGDRFKVADARLNASYKVAMARLSPERQAALRAEQRTWLANRDSGCEADVAKDGIGGTAAVLSVAGCRVKRTEDRATAIESFQ